MTAARPRVFTCDGCGVEHDLPWGYCIKCTAVLLDMGRAPEHRLNSQDVLDAHVEKMRAYAEEHPQ